VGACDHKLLATIAGLTLLDAAHRHQLARAHASIAARRPKASR
jgi:hypothetical protein